MQTPESIKQTRCSHTYKSAGVRRVDQDISSHQSVLEHSYTGRTYVNCRLRSEHLTSYLFAYSVQRAEMTCKAAWYSLDDIPQVSSSVETQQSVLDAHFVERRSFLVAEECVRDPDSTPAVVTETKLSRSRNVWDEGKSRVSPRLTQVHTYRVVLQYSRSVVSGRPVQHVSSSYRWMIPAGCTAILYITGYILA